MLYLDFSKVRRKNFTPSIFLSLFVSISSTLNLRSSAKTPREREPVGVFQIPSHGKARSKPRDFRRNLLRQNPLQIKRGYVAIDGGICGDDDFLHSAFFCTAHERSDIQFVRTDSFHRANHASKDVEKPVEFMERFYRGNILRLLHNANHTLIAQIVRANRAWIFFGPISTNRARMNFFLKRNHLCAETFHISSVGLQKKIRDSARAFFPDSRKARKTFHEFFDCVHKPSPGTFMPPRSEPDFSFICSRIFDIAS